LPQEIHLKNKPQSQPPQQTPEAILYHATLKQQQDQVLRMAEHLGHRYAADVLFHEALEEAYRAGYCIASGLDPFDGRCGVAAQDDFSIWYAENLRQRNEN
jgi:hypothetical protein